jgi:hypothetical protein
MTEVHAMPEGKGASGKMSASSSEGNSITPSAVDQEAAVAQKKKAAEKDAKKKSMKRL